MDSDEIRGYIGIGSNLGDRAGNLLLAVRGLMEAGLHVERLSAIYETEPDGVAKHNNFLNLVAEITLKNITPRQLLARMLRLEYLLGRRNKFLKAPRSIDLDLLIYGDIRHDTEYLEIPHGQLHLRKFVLVPLAELAPNLIHPIKKQSIAELLENLDDSPKVVRWYPTETGNAETVKETSASSTN